MGKVSKVIVCGMKGVGKTCLLEQLVYGTFNKQEIHPTIEDIYEAIVDTDRGTKEAMRFYDTEGFSSSDLSSELSLPKHYHSIADGFVIVYSKGNASSIKAVEMIKRDIERNKEKKELQIVIIGLAASDKEKAIETNGLASLITKDKVKHFDVSVSNDESVYAPFIFLASKINPVPTKGGFAPLGMVTRKS